MESTLPNALALLIIGMTTVFIVLSLVVLTGNVLVKITNKYAPIPPPATTRSLKRKSVDPAILAVIAGVVEHITSGKGKVKSIKKVK